MKKYLISVLGILFFFAGASFALTKNISMEGYLQITNTDGKLMMTDPSTPLTIGLASEVNGQLLDYGSNYAQLANLNTAYPGGFFRIDLRPAYATEFFNVKYIPPGSAETTIYKVSTTGDMTMTGSMTATSFYGDGSHLTGIVIPTGSITTGAIAPNTINAGDMASGAITSDAILNGTIIGADLASSININTTGAVTAAAFFGNGFALTNVSGTFIRKLIFTSGTTYTSSTDANKAYVEMVGGGGGGGGVTAAAGGAGGGGGAGGYTARVFAVTPNTAYTYALGAAGAGNSGAAGGNGGTTSITIAGITMTASFGAGGVTTAGGGAIKFMSGGAGGTPGTNGDLMRAGEPGMPGMTSTVTTVVCGGNGGSGPFGAGGLGRVNVSAVGLAGTGFGSGGGGAAATAATVNAGGAGTAGAIVIWEFR